MEFHRQRRKALTVPIIPLVDILVTVLIFVIVTYDQKKVPRPSLTIDLPTIKEVSSNTVVEPRSVLAVDANGRVMIDDQAVVPGMLVQYLEAFQKANPGRKLELEADKAVNLEQLFEVWDALAEVGIEIKEVPARIRLPQEVSK